MLDFDFIWSTLGCKFIKLGIMGSIPPPGHIEQTMGNTTIGAVMRETSSSTHFTLTYHTTLKPGVSHAGASHSVEKGRLANNNEGGKTTVRTEYIAAFTKVVIRREAS